MSTTEPFSQPEPASTSPQAPASEVSAAHAPGAAPAMTVPERPHRAGRIVLIAAIILLALSLTLSVVLGILGAPYVDRSAGGFQFNFQFGDPRPTVSLIGLLAPLHALGGGLVGVWIIVQSIVAIAADWGRTAGIVALVLAVVTPMVSVAIFVTLLLTVG